MPRFRRLASITAVTFALLGSASAQDPILGEIKWFGFNFCPRGFAAANGQLLPIAQNSALFSLYGTNFGGDGRATFALPDLRGRVMISAGQGPALTDRRLGEKGGSEEVTLQADEIPSHNHALRGTTNFGNVSNPSGVALADGRTSRIYSSNTGAGLNAELNGQSIGQAGGGQPHANMPPYTTLTACVALQGIFPSRN
ncbi:MAG: tail fiber protein [Parvularcula sp.]|jgi:microcystin-dependent protein|nr:tail fiber protein [Parvularcula sp.]